jgi:uncharacterized protein YkwD
VTLIALAVVGWVLAVLFVMVILRGVALADQDDARRRQELRREAATHEPPRRHVGTMVLFVSLGLFAASAGVDAPDASAACAGAPEAATLCLINAERRARGRPALAVEPRLALAAQRYSADMVARGYFSHVSPEGASLADRLRRVGYAGACAWRAGETLAWGFGDQRTPASRVAAWMHSPRHRRVLLSRRYRDVGVGIARGVPDGADGGLTYTAELGRRGC